MYVSQILYGSQMLLKQCLHILVFRNICLMSCQRRYSFCLH